MHRNYIGILREPVSIGLSPKLYVNRIDDIITRYSVTIGSREQDPYTTETEAIAMALR